MRDRLFKLITILILFSCVSPIAFDLGQTPRQFIVEGLITDGPPPYLVKLGSALDLGADSLTFAPESNAIITLYDTEGNAEQLVETEQGHYESSGIIQGVVGGVYSIMVETSDGVILSSVPDTMKAVGSMSSIRYEFESKTNEKDFGEVNADVFNVFVDADGGPEDSPNIRWRMNGIYRVITWPHLHMTEVVPNTPYKNPPPCSGYIVVEGLGGGKLLQIGPCTCCDCWAYQYESFPSLSTEYIVEDNRYQQVKVGEVPITNYTFHDKYLVQIEQMSLSNASMAFFESVKAQKESATDLFQPQIGALNSNIVVEVGSGTALGIFYASSTSSTSLYIEKEAVPYPIIPITFLTLACYEAYDNATNIKPDFWID